MKLADLVQAGKTELITQYGSHLTPQQRRALYAIENCRNGAFGSTLMHCDECGRNEHRQRSCGHRSCPQCQHHTASHWLERQQAKLLPVRYFMITFTLPADLRPLAYAKPKEIYPMLFQAAMDTLRTFTRNHPQLNGDPGACAILHTHTRRLDYHPHVHVIVPGCAIDSIRKQWRKLRDQYLFNGKKLARVFRAKLIHALNLASLSLPVGMRRRWVVQCKQVGHGLPALKYLSRYLYRGVISERDLIEFDQELGTVRFRYIDGKSGQPAYRTLSLVDFLWRIMMQVLPSGFRRVREYGFLHGNSRHRIILLQVLLHVSVPPVELQTSTRFTCPACRAPMRVVGFVTRLHPT
jgi:ribosomal protein L37AE/L43A